MAYINDMYENDRVKNLHLVFNDVKEGSGAYGYTYDYGYNYGYTYNDSSTYFDDK